MRLLFEKNICSLKILFTIYLLFVICILPATAQMSKDSFNTKSGTVIMFERFDKKYYATLQYLKFADRLISAYINSSAIKQKYTCRIFILDDTVKGDINIIENSKSVNIYLNRDFRTSENKFTTISKMINAMLLAKTGFKPNDVKVTLPAWIIVGIYGKLELRFTSHSVLPVSYFPGLKALCQSDKLPDFRLALSTALNPDQDGIAYQLYQELCRFTMLEIKELSSRSDNPIADLIFLSARKKYSSNEVFNSTILRSIIKYYDKMNRRKDKKYNSNALSESQKIQKWFKKIAEKRLINVTSPLQTKFFKERFQRFRKFSYNYKEKNKKAERMIRDISKLNEIYDKYEMDKGFEYMMNKKFLEIDALLMVCQPLAKKHLERIRTVLGQFDDMSSVIIRDRLEKALVKLKDSLAKQQKIEDYLRKIEYSTVDPGKLYRKELIENKRLNSNFCPAINKYLSKVEKNFLED